MKQVDKEYYDSLDRRKRKSPARDTARKVIDEFIRSGMEIVELEEEDFEGLFKFKDDDVKIKAAALLRNLLNTVEYRKTDVFVSCRKGHLFLMRK